MENINLNTQVTQYFNDIEQLKNDKKSSTADLYKQIRDIETSFDSQIRQVDKKLDALKEKYTSLAIDLAEEKGECPRSRWGSTLTPDEVDIKAEGIVLTWIQENRYGRDYYDYFEASWDDLVAFESKQNTYTEDLDD